MALSKIAARPQKLYLSIAGLNGDTASGSHVGLVAVEDYSLSLNANRTGSTYLTGFASSQVTLQFATDDALTFFLKSTLTGATVAPTLIGGGAYGLESSYRDSLTLVFSQAKVVSVVDYATGGFAATLSFGSFDYAGRDLQANGLLAAPGRFGSDSLGTDVTLAPGSGTGTTPSGHVGVPTKFYFTAAGLTGPVSGGPVSQLFGAVLGDMTVSKNGTANPNISSMTVTLPEGEVALDTILSKMVSQTHLSSASVYGFSGEGLSYEADLGDVQITSVDLSHPGQVTLTLAFRTIEWDTVDFSSTGTAIRYDAAIADLARNVYSSGGGSPPTRLVKSDFTPVATQSVGTPERFFVSVAGWKGDVTSGLHTGLFEAASVELPTLQASGTATVGSFVNLVFASQDSAARFFDAMAGNSALPAVTVYESVNSAAGLRDIVQFDLGGAKVTQVTTRGAQTLVTLSYTAFEATSFPLDPAGNPLAPVHYGADLTTGTATTVPDAPVANTAPNAVTSAPMTYFVSFDTVTGNHPLQFQVGGTVNALLASQLSFTGSRNGSSYSVGSVSLILPEGLAYLPKFDLLDASGQLLRNAKIYGYSPQGLTYELDLTNVRIEYAAAGADGSVELSLVPAQYSIHTFDYPAGAPASTIDETSGYNKTGPVVTAYTETSSADQSAFPTAPPTLIAANPEKYYFSIAGWIGDSDSQLHSGLFELSAPSLPVIVNNTGSTPSASNLTVNFSTLDGLANFVGALASNTAISQAGLFGSGSFGGSTEADSMRMGLTDVRVVSVSMTSNGYSANLTFNRYAVDTKGLNSSGTLTTVVAATGYDFQTKQSVGGTVSATLNTNSTDGSNNAAPTSFFLKMSGVTSTYATADTANLLPILSYSFDLQRNGDVYHTGSTVAGGLVSLVFDSSSAASADFLRLMTDATVVSQADILGYNDVGQVFDLALSNLHVLSVQTRMDGLVVVSLDPASFTLKTVDVTTGGAPIRSQSAGFNFSTAVGTAFSQATISSVPAPTGPLDSAPIVVSDSYILDGSAIIAGAAGVLANDSDPDGQAFLQPVLASPAAHGVVTFAPDGGFSYAAAAGFSGYDSFSYQVTDVFGAVSGTVPVNLTVYLAGATSGDDTINGTANGDLMRGLSGNDVLMGNDGNDSIDGGAGINALYGGNGNDRLIVDATGSGSSVDGGTGTDTLAVSGAVSLGGISGIEAIEFTAGSNLTLSASQLTGLASNTLLSGSGTLTVNLEAGGVTVMTGFQGVGAPINIVVNGSAGDDYIKASHFNNTISGGLGRDFIRGGNGVDTIDGGADNDKITGWGGADILTGGAGADQFRYFLASDSGTGAAADRITDFAIGSDVIDLRLLDSDLVTPDIQSYALSFIGTSAFGAGGAGQIRTTTSGSDMLVQFDLDGNGTSDMEIVLQGLAGQTLSVNDFLFNNTPTGASEPLAGLAVSEPASMPASALLPSDPLAGASRGLLSVTLESAPAIVDLLDPQHPFGQAQHGELLHLV